MELSQLILGHLNPFKRDEYFTHMKLFKSRPSASESSQHFLTETESSSLGRESENTQE